MVHATIRHVTYCFRFTELLCKFSKRILKCYLRPHPQALRKITKDQGTFDDLACPVRTVIDIMGAWFGDESGLVQCTLPVTQVDGGYYNDIINKCHGRYQCSNLDVRIGGSMWCPASRFNADTIDTVTIHYRCLQSPPGTVQKFSLTSKFCLQLNPTIRNLSQLFSISLIRWLILAPYYFVSGIGNALRI